LVSTPYTRGRSLEYRTLQMLRSEGWFCSRSAASHGPVDIFAGRGGATLIIQVKGGRGRVSEAEKEVLREWAKAYRSRAEIWRFRKRKLEKELVYDAHEQQA